MASPRKRDDEDVTSDPSSVDDTDTVSSSEEEESVDNDPLDPFQIQKDIKVKPKTTDYLKIESMVGDQKWSILITPTFTVKDVLEKLTKRVDSKYKFFELIQTFGDKSQLLNPEMEISTIIASWGEKADLYKILFNFQEYKYVQFESELDSHKWQIKLGPEATVGFVIDKLANRIDSKYNVFELYLVTDKKKALLDRNEKIFSTIASFSPDVESSNKTAGSHNHNHARLKYVFRYSVREDRGDINERAPLTEQVKPHTSIVADKVDAPKSTDTASRRKPSKRGLGLPSFKPPPTNSRDLLIKQRNKFSSTSTLFLVNTMSKPDIDELVQCMAKALIFHIEKGAKTTDKVYFDLFDERLFPVSKEIVDFACLPSEKKVYLFVKRIYDFGRLDPECIIMALAYIEKIIAKTDVTIDTTNWRRITFIALAVALKTWEDFAVYNTEFLGVFNGKMTIKEVNFLEMNFLALIEFNVYLPASLYAKYYFELKAYSQVDEANFPLAPLNKEKAKLLELRTQSSQNLAKELNHTVSLDRLKPTRVKAPAILS